MPLPPSPPPFLAPLCFFVSFNFRTPASPTFLSFTSSCHLIACPPPSLSILYANEPHEVETILDGKTMVHYVPKIPAVLWTSQQLTALHLHDGNLPALPQEIENLKNLLSLKVEKCGLREIPECIGQLSKLTTLVLSKNMLTSLPTSLGLLAELVTLIVSHNNLSILSENCLCLPKLQHLDLSFNSELSILPMSSLLLPGLQKLDIDSTGICDVPFDDMPMLSVLHACTSPRLPHCIGIAAAPRLVTLALKLDCEDFPIELTLLPLLEQLTLDQSSITCLPPEISRLSLLSKLSCNYCCLRELPESLASLWSLTQLLLRCNELTRLPPSLSALQSLRQLDIRDNPALTLPFDTSTPEVTAQNLRRQQQTLFRPRAFMLGNSGSGKTSLALSISRGLPTICADDIITRPLIIHSVDLYGGINFDLWDCTLQCGRCLAGRAQCWLPLMDGLLHAEDSLVLVLVDISRDIDTNSVAFWVRMVAANSKRSTILFVANKADACSAEECAIRCKDIARVAEQVYRDLCYNASQSVFIRRRWLCVNS